MYAQNVKGIHQQRTKGNQENNEMKMKMKAQLTKTPGMQGKQYLEENVM